jgi:hypothetical protein
LASNEDKAKGTTTMNIRQLLTAWLILSSWCWSANAQATAFTYQGKLTEGNLPANAAYDFQFTLFDALSGGAQIGTTVSNNGVTVSGGVFTVTLDFGASAFPGAPRFLEISLRPAGMGAFTTLNPRQPVTAVPYAIKSLGATAADGLSPACAGCVTSAQIGSLPASSGSYIQNTTTQQATSNFNISGNGTVGGTLAADTVNAATQYNLGGNRILSAAGTNNFFAGVGAGQANTSGNRNTFVGRSAGQINTTGFANSFFGYGAGSNNTGGGNSFFGSNAGASFTGPTGATNSFFGFYAGAGVVAGNDLTLIGANANVGVDNLANATAIGAGAIVSTSNTLVLGNNANVVVGGTEASEGKLSVNANSSDLVALYASIDGDFNEAVRGRNQSPLGYAGRFLGRVQVVGTLSFTDFGNASGGTPLCRNLANIIYNCSASSLRYKDNIQPLRLGLHLIQRLRPVTFNWKESQQSDLGLIAEEVAAIEPLLNTYNQKGEIEGVKYPQLTVVLINAVKEQQAQLETQARQITAQQAQLKQQQQQLDALRKLVCQTYPQAATCQE